MRKFITGILSILLMMEGFSQGAPPSKGIFVLPAIIDFNLSAGQVATRPVTIYNRTDQTTQFRIYFSDWDRDSLGRHVYLSTDNAPNSCTRWVSVDKAFIEVPSGGAMPFNLTLRLPDSVDAVKGMKWSMMFIELAEEKKVQLDTGVNRALLQIFRVGVHVTQTPPHIIRKEVRMTAFEEVTTDNADSLVYKIVTENLGDVQVRCKASIELTNLTTGEKIKLGPSSYPMYPGHKRVVLFSLPRNLPKGKYSMLAIADAGEDLPLEAAQKEIEIK